MNGGQRGEVHRQLIIAQLGRGKEWFSVVGVTEDNRPQRIAEAMRARYLPLPAADAQRLSKAVQREFAAR